MEIEQVIKSIVEKKVNAMSFADVMNEIFHGGKWFIVESEDYRERRDKIAEGLWGIVSKMKKEEILQVLKNSYHGIEGAAEHLADICGSNVVVGIDFDPKDGLAICPYSYTPAANWDKVLQNAREELACQMRKEYKEKIENKVGEILESL